MSAKQAKRLRQAARGLVVTLDQAGKDIKGRGLNYIEHRTLSPSSTVGVQEGLEDANPEGDLIGITAVNRPDSFRGIIRTLKKGMKSGKIDKLPSGKIPKQA